jgi:uncharacterized protein (DUF1330 family)
MSGSVDPSPEQLGALAGGSAEEMATPITMLNLLRFRDEAAYPDDFGAEPCSGEEAYQRYAEGAVAALAKVGGRPIWGSHAHQTTIGPAEENWDQAFLVFYPSRSAFLSMVQDPDYQAIIPHRSAALSDSRLIMCDHSEQAPQAFGAAEAG